MSNLKSYDPCYSETLVFVGAGSTAMLNMPTTNDQGDVLKCLAAEGSMENRVRSMNFFKKECNTPYIQTVSDFLTILEHKEHRFEISPEVLEAAKRLFKKHIDKYHIQESVVKNRIQELRAQYDLVTLISVYKDNCPVNDEDCIRGCFSFLDKMIQDSKSIIVKGAVVETDRYNAAYHCLNLLIFMMFEIAWFALEKSDVAKPYQKFMTNFVRYMQKESRDFADKFCSQEFENPFSDKHFYTASTSFVSFNFEVSFLYFLMNANGYLNKSQIYVGSTPKRVKHWIDFGTFKARVSKNNTLLEGYGMDEDGASRMNRDGTLSPVCNRVIHFHFAHGAINVRECPVCSRTFMYADDFKFSETGLFKYCNIMPPLPIPLFDYEPKSKEEEEYQKKLHTDSLQCVACGAETFSYSSPTIMQSLLKPKPKPFLEEEQRDLRLALSKARHVVMFGYSLPTDDSIWIQSFAEAVRRLKDDKDKAPYCSIVVGYKGEPRWIYGKEVEEFFKDPKKHLAGYGYDTYKIIKTLFKEENIRLYAGGIPKVFGESSEQDIKELLYPDFVKWNGTRLEK